MFRSAINIFKIPDLRNKILFTIALLVIYRLGFHISVPGVDQKKMVDAQQNQQDTPMSKALNHLQMLTGGNLGRSSIFGLGIMPYITSSIIFMLLGEVLPALKKLKEEGQTGYKKIQEYTRYLAVPICVIQALMFLRMTSVGYAYPGMESTVIVMGVIAMTAGTIFLMWLGEQIDEYGIGNGISLLIMAGIVARLPGVIRMVAQNTSFTVGAGSSPGTYGPAKIMFLLTSFVFVVAGAILITQGQRRIPVQQGKQMRGRRMYGGQKHYLPLRINHGGVMPIIFASSLMQFPPIIFAKLVEIWPNSTVFGSIAGAFRYGGYTYNVMFVVMIFLFAYFWTTVQFQPKEMAKRLRDSGSFIPGLRPGHRTAEYLETVMMRITFFGASFLAIIAVVPSVISQLPRLNIDPAVATFLGGTGLLIVVSVSLDLVQRIESNLVMRNYEGFSSSGRIKGAFR